MPRKKFGILNYATKHGPNPNSDDAREPMRIGPCLVTHPINFIRKVNCLHGVLNKVYLQNFFSDGVTFLDESNYGN